MPIGDESEKEFRLRCRVPINDSDGAVARAERGRKSAMAGWMHVALKCLIHKGAGVRETLLDMDPDFISGATAFVLSLRSGTAMQSFREALREVLCGADFLEFDEVSPPTLAGRQEVVAILDVFMTKPITKNHVRRSVVCSLVHRITDKGMTHNERACGHCADRAFCRGLLVTSLVAALVPAIPKNFPGRNWINNEDAFECLGLLDAFRLLRPAYERFVQKMGGDIHRGPAELEPMAGVPAVVDVAAEAADEAAPAAAAGVAR